MIYNTYACICVLGISHKFSVVNLLQDEKCFIYRARFTCCGLVWKRAYAYIISFVFRRTMDYKISKLGQLCQLSYIDILPKCLVFSDIIFCSAGAGNLSYKYYCKIPTGVVRLQWSIFPVNQAHTRSMFYLVSGVILGTHLESALCIYPSYPIGSSL